ncbi:hypothetical protein [Luteitalea sp.]
MSNPAIPAVQAVAQAFDALGAALTSDEQRACFAALQAARLAEYDALRRLLDDANAEDQQDQLRRLPVSRTRH